MSTPTGSRAAAEEERTQRQTGRAGENMSDTPRRSHRLLDHERWLDQFHIDAEKIKDEDIGAESGAW
ncbi:MAG: hypothetical protein QM619_15195 [Micropruina sp.]|uniref:hypothetical protein n=1 Tax=Micropruina sp. TaxID=2737536 RepID=UPI0039E508AA